MTASDWEQLKYLSEFVADINFSNEPYKPAAAEAVNADLYVIDSGNNAFGWARAFKNNRIDNTRLTLSKPEKGIYSVLWYDTWTGKILKTEKISAAGGKLVLTVPALERPCQDIAFKISKI
jgi:hypothetical protein